MTTTLRGFTRGIWTAAVIGAVALVVVGAYVFVEEARLEERHRRIIELQAEADAVSARADALLLDRPSTPELTRFAIRARALQTGLESWSDVSPAVPSALDAIDEMLAIAERHVLGPPLDVGAPPTGPLSIPAPAVDRMTRMAAAGIVLDASMRDVTTAFHRLRDRRHVWLDGGTALIIALFSAGAMLIAGRLRGMVVGPLSDLTDTADRIASGDGSARAVEQGPREFRQLAFALNAALDRRARDQELVAQRNEQLALRASRLAEAQRIAQLGTWSRRPNEHVHAWSNEMYRITGTDPEGFRPTVAAFEAMVVPEDRPKLDGARAQAEAGETIEPLLLRLRRPDGALRWVRLRTVARSDGAGPPSMLEGSLQDVTDLVEVERELEQERRLRELASRVGRVGGWSVDLSTGQQNWSDIVNEIHETPPGYAPDVENAIRFYAPWARPIVQDAFERAIAEGEPYDLELQIDTAGGRRVWVRAVGEAVRDEQGRIMRVEGAFQDIQARKGRETELEEERRLRDMASRLGRVGGWRISVPDLELGWSDIVRDIHEVPPDYEPDIESALAFFAPSSRPIIRLAVERAIDEGEAYEVELELDTAAGRRIWVRTMGDVVRDEEGRVVAVEGAMQDIDAQKRSEERAQRVDRRLREVLEAMNDGFIAVDADGMPSFVNDAARTLLGRDRLPHDTAVWDLLPPHVQTEIKAPLRHAIRERTQETLIAADVERSRWLEFSIEPTGEDVAVLVRDISERARLTSQLFAREAELVRARDELETSLAWQTNLLSTLPANVALVDTDGTILDVNERWREFGRGNGAADPPPGEGWNYLETTRRGAELGAPGAAEIADALERVLAGDRDVVSLEYPCHGPDVERWFLAEVRPVEASEGHRRRAVVMHVDVTESHQARERLERLAYEDTLTGLLNRRGFVERLDATAADAWPSDLVLVAIDVRNMSTVNDMYGFAAGDALLHSIARRLAERSDPPMLVARIGDDEFALLAPRSGADGTLESDSAADGAPQPTAITSVRRLVATAVGAPHEVAPDLSVSVDAHVGLTRLGPRRRPAEELLHEAQLALAEGRDGPGPSWSEFDETLETEVRGRNALAEELRAGIERDELRLHYHPKVYTRTGKLYAAEALVRWQHPDRGLLGPGMFISLAEQTGLIARLGAWVVDRACRSVAAWRDAVGPTRIAVNASPEELLGGGYADMVLAAVERHGIDPISLTVEVTESVFARDAGVVAKELRRLRAAGVRVSLDDFGTGYASLAYLKTFPFDHIKIDRMFVNDMVSDEFSRSVIESVTTLARSLGASVIAEGVETEEQRRLLIDLRCEIAQGYYFCLPLEGEDFEWLLSTRQPLPLPPTS